MTTHDDLPNIDDAEDIAWLERRRKIIAFRAATDIAGHPPGWLTDQLDTDHKRTMNQPKDAA